MEWIYSLHHYVNSSEEAVAVALKNGCDQEGGGTAAINTIPQAINDSLITIDDVNRALSRLLRVRLMLGVFDPPTFVEYNYLYNSSSTVESPQHLAVALDVARKSIGLYKNNDDVLPLDPIKVKEKGNGIAVIGPQFIGTDVLMGNYGTYPDKGITTILEALRLGINETFDENPCKSESNVIYSQPNGLNGSMVYNELECANLCYQDDECNYYSFLTTTIYYGSSNAGYLSNCFLKNTNDGYNATVKDWNSGSCLNKNMIKKSQIHNSLGCQSVRCENNTAFEKALNLVQSMYNDNNLGSVIIGLGLNQTIESESRDRETIELPGDQMELVQYIYDFTSKQSRKIPIICVLIHGGTLALGTAYDQCDAILDGWYPAQMGGYAIADVIYGYYNPAGRASVTSYLSTEQLPQPGQQDLYAGNGTTYRYFNGDVLFPFGFGLSYTTFEYSNLRTNVSGNMLDDPCAIINVTVSVKNTGKMDGDEVVQLYVEQPDATVPRPNVRLGDFERVEDIKVGEERNVSLILTPRYRSVVYNGTQEPWYKPNIMIEQGNVVISVGGGQPKYFNGALKTTIKVTKSVSFYTCDNQD